jgi:hypothetical protein
MKRKETRVSRGAPPFISKAGASPIPNIERRALERNVSISYAPYKAHFQLGQNSGRIVAVPDLHCSCPVLTVSFPF